MPRLMLGELNIDVVYKDIKHLHLSVYPPNGKVRISAPERFDLDTLRIYAISKLDWIRKQQTKLDQQAREPARDYINRESHFYLGRRFLLKISEVEATPKVILKHRILELRVRPRTSKGKRETLLDEWYRKRLKETIPPMIQKWERVLKIEVSSFGIKKMKTKWGSCNPRTGKIWLNLELAKKPMECLEYVTVHEMVHLLEKTHGERFSALMDHYLPTWKLYKDQLNRWPLSHQTWSY